MRHLPGLDGLRGVLIVGIIAYHLGYADHWFVSVDTFFALSGFLITRLLVERTPTNRHELRSWWARRARRLVPAVALTTTVVVVVFAGRPGVHWDAIATMTWWENWRQAAGDTNYWSPRPSPLRHAWTLSIEEQFYLAWPVLTMALGGFARRRSRDLAPIVAVVATTGAAASFAWSAWLAGTGESLNRIYLGTDTRVGAILLGCAAGALIGARIDRPAGARITGIGLAGAAIVIALGTTLHITDPITYQGGLALATAGSVLLVVAASCPGPIATVLGVRPLQWLGARSYGIYLWAWPAQAFVEERWPRLDRPVVAGTTLAVGLALGDLSYRVVEMPLRNRTAWATGSRPRRIGWTLGFTALVTAVLLVTVTARPTPYYQDVSAEESAAAALDDARASVQSTTTIATTTTTTTTTDTVTPTIVSAPPSIVGPTSGLPPLTTTTEPFRPLRIMTAGDSQAFKAAHPKIARSRLPPYIESVTVAGVLGCGILVRAPEWTMYDPARGGDVSGAYCVDTAEVAEIEALRASPDWMVLFSGGFERPFGYKDRDGRLVPARDPELRASIVEHLTSRIERARTAGTRTALVEWACMGEEVGDEEKAGWTRWHNAILAEVAASIPGTLLLKPNANVCVDADPLGAPTPAKERAWGYEVHPVDLEWLWNVQLGPELLAASTAG